MNLIPLLLAMMALCLVKVEATPPLTEADMVLLERVTSQVNDCDAWVRVSTSIDLQRILLASCMLILPDYANSCCVLPHLRMFIY